LPQSGQIFDIGSCWSGCSTQPQGFRPAGPDADAKMQISQTHFMHAWHFAPPSGAVEAA